MTNNFSSKVSNLELPRSTNLQGQQDLSQILESEYLVRVQITDQLITFRSLPMAIKASTARSISSSE